ncbi:hypothetical protein CFB03_01140 [Salmonella enterica subsp. enterica serovar Typhimurium]|nr:hypothetical protein CFB03_01140 [Salmonella enterica subsp. enterica serovar Typhimurium]
MRQVPAIGFHGIVIPGTLRDSIFVLEGLLEQETGLNPTEIMTDTAGASEQRAIRSPKNSPSVGRNDPDRWLPEAGQSTGFSAGPFIAEK